MLGVPSFADTVIESKEHKAHEGKTPVVVDSHMRVQKGAFAIGMEIRDILWPTTCTVLSVDKQYAPHGSHAGVINEGDVLHLHYRTYNPEETVHLLTDILGDQPEDSEAMVYTVDENHVTPAD